jgi:hypothetical protein
MKDGNIAVGKDGTGKLYARWESPVCELSYRFMGKHIALLRYAVLKRHGKSYARVVNREWFWWWLYFSWDWLCYQAGRLWRRVNG